MATQSRIAVFIQPSQVGNFLKSDLPIVARLERDDEFNVQVFVPADSKHLNSLSTDNNDFSVSNVGVKTAD